ncbi:DUF3613 domain-containing protein [Burkholderia gladioli]|uniref:DUF3613 domain-containing protein n=1 Tax=Burkholderia gladioli TaxID=28095 RepID=UPI003B97E55E
MKKDTEPTMPHFHFQRRRQDILRVAIALTVVGGAFSASNAFAQVPDPALVQLQQQLQPMQGSSLLAPADAQPQPAPAVQQVQAAPQPLPAVAPQAQLVPPSQAVQAQAEAPVLSAAPPPEPSPPAQVAVQPAPPADVPRPLLQRRSDVGPSTEAWLDLQRSNRAASNNEHPFEGAAATYAYERYLQSFKRPIPTWFNSVQRVQGGGSSGGGDSQSQ